MKPKYYLYDKLKGPVVNLAVKQPKERDLIPMGQVTVGMTDGKDDWSQLYKLFQEKGTSHVWACTADPNLRGPVVCTGIEELSMSEQPDGLLKMYKELEKELEVQKERFVRLDEHCGALLKARDSKAARVQELEDELRELRDDPTIGKEAEELRKGIEDVIECNHENRVDDAACGILSALQELLDNVDARDSLHYLAKEANKKADQRVEVKMPKVTCSPVYAAPMDFDEPMEVSPQKPLDKLVQKALNFIKAYRVPGNYSDLVANGKGPMWDALVKLDIAATKYEAERKKQGQQRCIRCGKFPVECDCLEVDKDLFRHVESAKEELKHAPPSTAAFELMSKAALKLYRDVQDLMEKGAFLTTVDHITCQVPVHSNVWDRFSEAMSTYETSCMAEAHHEKKSKPVCEKCGGTGKVGIDIPGGSSVGSGPCSCEAGQEWAHEKAGHQPWDIAGKNRDDFFTALECSAGNHEADEKWGHFNYYDKPPSEHGPWSGTWTVKMCKHCKCLYVEEK